MGARYGEKVVPVPGRAEPELEPAPSLSEAGYPPQVGVVRLKPDGDPALGRRPLAHPLTRRR